MDDLDIPQIPNCVFHPNRDSVDRCAKCNRWICSDCIIIFEGSDLCKECMVQHRRELSNQIAELSQELDLWKNRLKTMTTTELLQFPDREVEIREKIDQFSHRLKHIQEIYDKILT